MPTIKDVARVANVSIATVSNVLTGAKRVSPKLEGQVLDAVKRLGYQPDPLASGIRSKSTKTIGLILPQIDITYFPLIVRGIQKTLEEQDYCLCFFCTNYSQELEKQYVETLLSHYVCGLIISSIVPESDTEYFNHLSSLRRRGKHIPVVSIQRDLSESGICSVFVDNETGGYLATRHLIEKGCSQICCIGGQSSSVVTKKRLSGYKRALEESNISFNSSRVLYGDFSAISGYHNLNAYSMFGLPFDGIFAQNDLMALGAIKFLFERSINVPQDVKIVGFDNTFVASITTPSISSVHIPEQRLGEDAAQLLLNLLSNPDATYTEAMLKSVMPLFLVERQSTNQEAEWNWELFI